MGEQVQPPEVQSIRVALKWAELHAPLFLAGCNLQMKLDPTKRVGLELVYDRAEKELLVSYNGEQAIVPLSSVLSMVPVSVAKPAPAPVAAAPKPAAAPIKAQVSGPQHHVFAGPGGGKSR